jgi:hypothetical protein
MLRSSLVRYGMSDDQLTQPFSAPREKRENARAKPIIPLTTFDLDHNPHRSKHFDLVLCPL